MAYVDQNGLVLIDDVEANADIKRLQESLVCMDEALSYINSIVEINDSFKGDTAVVIQQSTTELMNKVVSQKKDIVESISQINMVLDKYREIDSNIKNRIDSSI